MAGKSDYLENKLLDHILKAQTYTAPSAVYVGLYTAAPSDSGGGTECSGGSYARVSASFGLAVTGASSNDADVTFPTATAAWGTVSHFGLFDASTSGNLLYWGALGTSKAVDNGDTASFASGSLQVTED